MRDVPVAMLKCCENN